MRKVDFNPDFKQDMSNIEIEGVETIIKNFKYENGEMSGDSEIQFAYTSSSSYATHNIMSPLYFTDDEEIEYTVDHVGITKNDMLILVCEDDDEETHYFEIEPKDF